MPVPPPIALELGISGTPNFGGDLHTEPNPELYHQAGFGNPGTRTWGTWEETLRTDPDVAASLEFLLGQVRDARYDVAPYVEHPDPAVAEKQAAFVRWCLFEKCEPGPSELFRQMTQSLVYGFALHEIVPELMRHESLPGGLGWGVRKLAERLPVSVHATNGWIESGGELAAIRQVGVREGKWVETILPADKILLTTWNRDGNNYAGRSAYRPVRYLVKVRAQLLRIVGISYIREGAGLPIASTTDLKAKLTPKQRKALFKLLGNLVFHENAAAVLPAGWKLEWVYSQGANKGHVVDAWVRLGEVILRQLSAQQMTLGVNGTGSRSVGEVHDATQDAFTDGVLANLERTINGVGARSYTGLVPKLVRWNWGEQPGYPKLTLQRKKAKLKPIDRANAAKVAKDAGLLTITAADEAVVREDLGFPAIDPLERQATIDKTQAAELEKLAAQPAPFGQPPRAGAGASPKKAPPAELEDDELEDDEPEELEPPKKAKAGGRALFVPSRPLRAAEKVLDLQGMLDFLDASRTRFEAEIRPVVGAMLIQAAPELKKAMSDGDPSDVHTVALDASKLEQAIAAFMDRTRRTGRDQVRAELAKHKSEKVADERRGPDLAPGEKLQAADPVDEGDDEETSGILERFKLALARRITTRLRAELENEAIDALRTGDGDAGEVVADVLARQLETGAFRSDAGSILTKVWNLGRAEAAAMMGASVAEYSAILDGRQCIPCDRMDGRRFEIDSPEYDANLPPNRDCEGGGNCRCMMAYVPGSAEY